MIKRPTHLADLACLRLQDRKTAELRQFVSSSQPPDHIRLLDTGSASPIPSPAGAAFPSASAEKAAGTIETQQGAVVVSAAQYQERV